MVVSAAKGVERRQHGLSVRVGADTGGVHLYDHHRSPPIRALCRFVWPAIAAGKLLAEGVPLLRTCSNCVNSDENPAILIGESGLCSVCSRFAEANNTADRERELAAVIEMCRTATSDYGCLVGVSGGKDSTAALINAINLGLRPLAFTIQSGYYPDSIAIRASAIAKELNVQHVVIDLADTITPYDMQNYEMTVSLHDELHQESSFREFWTRNRLRELYRINRWHYSVRDNGEMPYVRPCQVCRRPVIRKYHQLAEKLGIPVVILGINEWTSLGSTAEGNSFQVSGIRELRPAGSQQAVTVAHLPFLLGQTIEKTRELLDQILWRAPQGEELVETGANSCIFAAVAEALVTPILGFNPDTTRLAREVTAGFLPRATALETLNRPRSLPLSSRAVLNSAGLVKAEYSPAYLQQWRERLQTVA
jgi:hypothetical protein